MFPLVRKKGMPVVERRLEPALVSSVTASVGLWIFGEPHLARALFPWIQQLSARTTDG